MSALGAWFRRRRDWCPHSQSIAWLTDPPVANALTILGPLLLGWLAVTAPWIAVALLIAGGLAGWACRTAWQGRVKGWRAGDAGLLELRWGLPGRLYPWGTIEQLLDTPEMLSVVVDGKVLWLPQRGSGVAELAQELHARLDTPGEAGASLDPEQVAEWLGVPVDGVLEMWVPPWQRRLMLGFVGVAMLLLIVQGLTERRIPGFWPGLLPIVFWPPLFRSVAAATAWGVRSGRRSARWDEIQQATQVSNGWHVRTRRGTLCLPLGPESARVAKTVKQVIAARRAGHLLPRMTDIPDHALSRAESVEVSAERGISPADRRQP